MKKILKALIFAVMISSFIACGKDAVVNETNNGGETTTVDAGESSSGTGVRYAERYRRISFSEAGVLYDGNDDRLRLLTIDEGKNMIFCYNPNCAHSTLSGSSCMAYLGGLTKTMYYDGAIYYLEKTSIYAHKIYKMETNGAGRELVASLPFRYELGYFCICREDKMYYTAIIVHEDETTKQLSETCRVVEVDLLDGSYRFITEDSTDIITIATIKGNNLYMRLANTSTGGRLNLVVMNLETLEMKTVISEETWRDEYVFADAYDEDSYIYLGRTTREVGIRNIDGTIERVLFGGAPEERYGEISVSDKWLYYMRLYDYEDEPAGHYFMDLDTGEVIDITDEAEKYGIESYSAEYDAFFRCGTSQEADHGMWSREKILSEARAGQE